MSNTNDLEAIYRENQDFAAVWNKGDAKGLASFYTEDAVRVGATGEISHGRAEVEAAYDRLLHGPFTGAKVSVERGNIRILAADLALWQGAMQIDPGSGKPPIKGYVVQLMKNVSGRWLVLEAHPRLFPPPPK
jgi:uncharacterized protein (TIGR02246 family)